MLLLRSIDLGRRRIRIEISNGIRFGESDEVGETAGVPDDALEHALEKEAVERLIVEGLFNGRDAKGDISGLALRKLGMIGIGNAWKLNTLPARCKQIIIVARDLPELYGRIRIFDRTAGVLLAHMIDCRLEVLIARA